MPRPRKPRELKILEGTYRPDRDHDADSPGFEPGMPDLPDGWADAAPWGPEAVEEFHRLGPGLVKLGLLSPMFRAAFLMYCDAFGRWTYYRRRIGAEGAVQESKSGYEQQRPTVSMINRAASDLRQSLALFGLSPADRSKVVALGGGQEDANPFEEFLK